MKKPKPFGRPVTLNTSIINLDPRLQMRDIGEDDGTPVQWMPLPPTQETTDAR